MIVHRADWVLPIVAPPIRHGWVAVEHGRIVEVGGARGYESGSPTSRAAVEAARPSEPKAILPALANAHVHLELSWMRGGVPPARSFPAWVTSMLALRRTRPADFTTPIRDAIIEARACGTTVVGDVTNTLASYEPLANSDLSAAVFFEQLGFNADEPEVRATEAQARLEALRPVVRLRPSVVPHAPYSVSPALMRAIAAIGAGRTLSIHLGESAEEVQFLKEGTGAWRALLDEVGAWNEAWAAPDCSPVEYLEHTGLLRSGVLVVHGVHLTDADLHRLASVNAPLVSCPRSNLWTGAGVPDVARFYASGVRVAVGTDSLASVDDLNVFHELAAMRAAAPCVPARRLLESATRIGAEVLGFAEELGTIEPGKRAELIAVRVPAGVEDVEEYLVGGVAAKDITWLDPDWPPVARL